MPEYEKRYRDYPTSIRAMIDGEEELPFSQVPRPRDWEDVAGTALAVLVIAAFWFPILYRVARGYWPWQ